MLAKVKDFMSREIAKINENERVEVAARIMAERRLGSLIITSNSKPVGIVTERDLVSRVLAEPIDLTEVSLSRVMSSPLHTVSSDQTLEKAAEIMMKYRIRRLPVVDNGILVGIITARDLVRALAEKVGEKPIRASEAEPAFMLKVLQHVGECPLCAEGLRSVLTHIGGSEPRR